MLFLLICFTVCVMVIVCVCKFRNTVQYIAVSLSDYIISGRIHYVMMVFCTCEEQCLTLFRWGFWASSPEKPSAGYSLQLMRMLQALTLECQTSASGFVQMLRWKNGLSESEVHNIAFICFKSCLQYKLLFIK